jgi:hypothetical protein
MIDAKLTDRRRWRGMARLHTGSNPVLTTKLMSDVDFYSLIKKEI